MSRETVGFIGLGDQGAPMARNLAKAGHDLVVLDLREAALAPFRQAGISVARSVSDVASQADVVAICVLDDAQVNAVVQGEQGLLASMKAGGLLLLHSTVSPELAISLAADAKERDIDFLDAPVSGSRDARESGHLTIFCGGSDKAFKRARPWLEAVGRKIELVGGAGSGQLCKICNNLMLYCNALTSLESARLAEAYGIDEKLMVDMALASSGSSWALQEWGFLDRLMTHHPLATSQNAVLDFLEKDLKLANHAAALRSVPMPMTTRALEIMRSSLIERHARATAGSAADGAA